MSTSPPVVICERIKHALRESPIAVFRHDGKYNGKFASTVQTEKRIRAEDSELIGIYYGLGGIERFNWAIEGDKLPEALL